MKIRIYVFVYALFFAMGVNAEDIYDNFYEFKVKLYNTEKYENREAYIKLYKSKIEKIKLSAEENLALQNFLILEEINLLYNNDAKKIYLMLKKQNEESKSFMQGKKNKQAGKWFLLSWGDIKSRYLQFLAGEEMRNEAENIKQLYIDALTQDKKFSPANISYALWLFFAPPIVGGGYEQSLKEFSKAVSNAKNKYEKYLALIFRSQNYFALEEKEAAKKDLKEASKLLENENFSSFIEEINKNEQIFFKQ